MVEDVAGVGKTTQAIASVPKEGIKQYGEYLREEIKKDKFVDLKRIEKDIQYEKFRKQVAEKMLTMGQTQIVESRKSINDLSLPFYERKWSNKGVFHHLKISPLVFCMLAGMVEPFWNFKSMNKHYAKQEWAEGNARLQKWLQGVHTNYVEPWRELIVSSADFKDIAETTSISTMPQDPMIQYAEPPSSQIYQQSPQAKAGPLLQMGQTPIGSASPLASIGQAIGGAGHALQEGVGSIGAGLQSAFAPPPKRKRKTKREKQLEKYGSEAAEWIQAEAARRQAAAAEKK